ncbi:MAG: 12-oxophytodienoate reductase [Planctomycetota bacterium]|nr:12-oxophytodienoate reductase [Planctomycetota bacterium]
MPTDALFSPLALPGLELVNRVSMAPMTRRRSPDRQLASSLTASYYARRAAGGVGLIITEGVRFDPVHRADTEDIPAIITDEQEEAWARVVRAVREASSGASRIAIQLWHTGRHGLDPIGPSPVPALKRGGGYRPTPRPMTRDDMDHVRRSFADAARRAVRAGFDAVEIHGAHGYLLDSFLSPKANQREDDFGGPLENRMRFPLSCVAAVREAVGPRYPVLYRFSRWTFDPSDPGNFHEPRSLARFVRGLRDAGASVLHVSTPDAAALAFPTMHDGGVEEFLHEPGLMLAPPPTTLSGWSRALSGLPTIAVGRVSVSASMGDDELVEITDPAPAGELVERGEADIVAVGRALIANPDWCALVRAGRWRELKPYSRTMLESLE